MLKLLVVEDHALVREGLVQTLRQLDDDITLFEAGDCEHAGEVLAENDIDLVLLDLGLPDADGLTCLSLLRKAYPATPVVIVSAYDDTHMVTRAMRGGASGFVPKSYSSDRLLAALRDVLAGQIFVPERRLPTQANVPLPPLTPLVSQETLFAREFGLSGRKAEILALMVRGKSNRDIAEQLGVGEGTIKVHITAIFKALGVTSRTQALVAVANHTSRSRRK
jgi:DNA-binding NarL/FixJ family response regulator